MDLSTLYCTGTIVADAQVRTTSAGKEMLSTRIAINGKTRDDASFMSLLVTGEAAVQLHKRTLLKGKRVFVVGSVQVKDWTNKEGVKQTGVTIFSNHISLLEKLPSKIENTEPAVPGRMDFDF